MTYIVMADIVMAPVTNEESTDATANKTQAPRACVQLAAAVLVHNQRRHMTGAGM